MKTWNYITVVVVLLTSISISAQNVGINVSEPSEPLEVGGMIFSSSDGFRFPDSSVQTRAATGFNPSDVSDKRGIIIMSISQIPGPFSFGYYSDVVKVFDFSWGSDQTITLHIGGGNASEQEIRDFTVLKEVDNTSIPLLEKYFIGAVIDEVNFYLYQFDTIQSNWEDYYHIILEAVYVTSINQYTEYAGGENYRHLESISFISEKITFEYNWENDDQDYIHNVVY